MILRVAALILIWLLGDSDCHPNLRHRLLRQQIPGYPDQTLGNVYPAQQYPAIPNPYTYNVTLDPNQGYPNPYPNQDSEKPVSVAMVGSETPSPAYFSTSGSFNVPVNSAFPPAPLPAQTYPMVAPPLPPFTEALPPPPQPLPTAPLPPPAAFQPSQSFQYPQMNPYNPTNFNLKRKKKDESDHKKGTKFEESNSYQAPNFISKLKKKDMSNQKKEAVELLEESNPYKNSNFNSKRRKKDLFDPKKEMAKLLKQSSPYYPTDLIDYYSFNPRRRKKDLAELKNEMIEILGESNPYKHLNFNSKRRKKDMADPMKEMDELLETGKHLLELSTKDDIDGEYSKMMNKNFSLDDIDMDSNVTSIPIPKGVQLKSVSNNRNKQVHSTVNITSSTQKTGVGNNTEIENVIEMDMEKTIEDEKGANQGSEEVRIVETERIKPVHNKRWKNLRFRRMNSFRTMRFPTLHRSKRSHKKPSSIFDKMAKNFFSTITRKERVANQNELSNQEDKQSVAPDRYSHEDQGNGHESGHHRDVIKDFINFFIKEMSKIKKSQENASNHSKPMKYSNIRLHNNTHSHHRVRRPHKTHQDYPERMSIVMNMNVSWEAKMREQALKGKRVAESPPSKFPTDGHKAPHMTSDVSTDATLEINLLFPRDNSYDGHSRFLDFMLMVTLLTFLVGLVVWVLPDMIRSGRTTRNSSVYRFYHGGKEEEEILGLESYDKAYLECTPNLDGNSSARTYRFYHQGNNQLLGVKNGTGYKGLLPSENYCPELLESNSAQTCRFDHERERAELLGLEGFTSDKARVENCRIPTCHSAHAYRLCGEGGTEDKTLGLEGCSNDKKGAEDCPKLECKNYVSNKDRVTYHPQLESIANGYCQKEKDGEVVGVESCGSDDESSDDFPQMEWQMETGAWLSE